MRPAVEEKLYVVANYYVQQYLREYHQLEDLGIWNPTEVTFINPEPICWQKTHREGTVRALESVMVHDASSQVGIITVARSRESLETLCRILGLETMHTIEVQHRVRCHGLYVKHQSGWSLA